MGAATCGGSKAKLAIWLLAISTVSVVAQNPVISNPVASALSSRGGFMGFVNTYQIS
jgi:hypothetical protein